MEINTAHPQFVRILNSCANDDERVRIKEKIVQDIVLDCYQHSFRLDDIPDLVHEQLFTETDDLTALSEKMPILRKLKRAIYEPALQASGDCQILPAGNAPHAEPIITDRDVSCCGTSPAAPISECYRRTAVQREIPRIIEFRSVKTGKLGVFSESAGPNKGFRNLFEFRQDSKGRRPGKEDGGCHCLGSEQIGGVEASDIEGPRDGGPKTRFSVNSTSEGGTKMAEERSHKATANRIAKLVGTYEGGKGVERQEPACHDGG